jgi:hypothetical protein
VAGSMLQIHETTPVDPAVFGASAESVLVFPDGWMYVIVHDAPGVVCILALAVPPIAPPVTVSLEAPAGAVLDTPLGENRCHATVMRIAMTSKLTNPPSTHPMRGIAFSMASSPSAN